MNCVFVLQSGNERVPKIFHQLICSHEPIRLRQLNNYLQLRVFDYFWSLPVPFLTGQLHAPKRDLRQLKNYPQLHIFDHFWTLPVSL